MATCMGDNKLGKSFRSSINGSHFSAGDKLQQLILFTQYHRYCARRARGFKGEIIYARQNGDVGSEKRATRPRYEANGRNLPQGSGPCFCWHFNSKGVILLRE